MGDVGVVKRLIPVSAFVTWIRSYKLQTTGDAEVGQLTEAASAIPIQGERYPESAQRMIDR